MALGKKKKKGVHKSATLKTQVEIPHQIKDLGNFNFSLTYIACTKKFCLTPRTIDFDVEVNIKGLETTAEEISSSAFIQKQIDQSLEHARPSLSFLLLKRDL